MKAFRFVTTTRSGLSQQQYRCSYGSLDKVVSESILIRRCWHRNLLITRKSTSTVAIDKVTSKKMIPSRDDIPIADKSRGDVPAVTDSATKITTTTTTTAKHSTKKISPLKIHKSSYYTPIPVNYDRSHENIHRLIQQRVLEREIYMKTNSIAQKELATTSISISSYIKYLYNIIRMGMNFKIPTQEELDIEFPIQPINWERITTYPNNNTTTNGNTSKMQITWFGHSTLLIQYPNGINILTDPIFSTYCSPYPDTWGPKRYRTTPCTLQDLLQNIQHIDYVLLSHNHYDHLDYPTIQQIYQYSSKHHNTQRKRTQFVVPLGLQHWLQQYIHSNIETYELDWYEHMMIVIDNSNDVQNEVTETLQIRSIPMKHWSSRYGYDRDRTLWCGYSIEHNVSSSITDDMQKGGSSTTESITKHCRDSSSSSSSKFLFAGDTAYYDQMKECVLGIPPSNDDNNDNNDSNHSSYQRSSSTMDDETTFNTTKYQYDVAAIPIGAYEPRLFMYYNHMNVTEAIQMKDDVSCHHAIPIHWGTYPLTMEHVMEPRNQLMQQMQHRNDTNTFVPWYIGETKLY